MPPICTAEDPSKSKEMASSCGTTVPSSSDDDSHTGVAIEFAPPPVDVKPDGKADISNSDSDESIADDPEADDELPVRRSTRSTAGHHSNRYGLPMSVQKR